MNLFENIRADAYGGSSAHALSSALNTGDVEAVEYAIQLHWRAIWRSCFAIVSDDDGYTYGDGDGEEDGDGVVYGHGVGNGSWHIGRGNGHGNGGDYQPGHDTYSFCDGEGEGSGNGGALSNDEGSGDAKSISHAIENNHDGSGSSYNPNSTTQRYIKGTNSMDGRIQIFIADSGGVNTIFVGLVKNIDMRNGAAELHYAACVRRYEGGGLATGAPASPSRCTLDKVTGPGIAFIHLAHVKARLVCDYEPWALALGIPQDEG